VYVPVIDQHSPNISVHKDEKAGFIFAALNDGANHYDSHLKTGLSTKEKYELVEYLESLQETSAVLFAGPGISLLTKIPGLFLYRQPGNYGL